MAGRPRKTLTDDQRAQVEALAADWSNIGPIVYGLAGADNQIVYVGATRNPKRRFAFYRSNKSCHNDRLSKWLTKNDCFVHVLHKGLDGLFQAERREIKSRSGLFNLICGGEQNWRDHAQKPWMGGTGILCPSAVILRNLKMTNNPCHGAYKKIWTARSASMTDSERTIAEIQLAMKLPQCNRIKKWLQVSSDRMIKHLEAA